MTKKKTKIKGKKNVPLPFWQKKRIALYVTAVLITVIELSSIFFSNSYTPETTDTFDARPQRIDNYFSKNKMPLAGHGKTFVEAADKCDMDWRLLPAIAVRESSGGKRMQYNNPFGWGGAKIPFANIDEAILKIGSHICGNEPNTEKWYSTTSTYTKLYRYNGTVVKNYPNEVMWIMEQF